MQLLLLLLLAVAGTAAGGNIPAVIVFGDSSVDTGNNNVLSTVLKSNFEPYGRDFYDGGRPTGRFCNGRVPPDFLSEAFGLKKAVPAYLDPAYSISDFATGVCFASAGTGYDNATSDVLLEYYKEYQTRLKSYVGETKAKEIITESVYLMSMGTNDFLENYYTTSGRRSQYSIGEYQGFLVGVVKSFIKELYNLGARKISLGGLPPMGCLPLERSTNFFSGEACIEEYNNVAMEFNGKLSGLVEELNKELQDGKVLLSNPYPILMDIIRKPSSYGFQVASMACCATGMFEMGYMCNRFNPYTCVDATKYVFWDSFHPTQKTNQIVADHIFRKVTAVIVFGDSSVDSGNNNWIPTIARSDFPPYGQNLPSGMPTGRFCNGKLASDFASEAFGLKELVPAYLDPGFGISDFATGVNFASAGTGYDNATSDVLSVIPLWTQVQYYKEYQDRLRAYVGDKAATKTITEALYVVSIGTNDFLENYFALPRRSSEYTIDDYQLFLVGLAENFLREIYSLGARKISFAGICPMGCLPLERATNMETQNACQEKYNIIARSFNDKLSSSVMKLSKELPKIKLVFANPYDFFQEVLSEPQAYDRRIVKDFIFTGSKFYDLAGFEVTDRGCCGTGEFEMGVTASTCPDPNKYVFWDSFHPTERINHMIIDILINTTWSQFL
ncbi:hypothetical protein V2J09_002691 [Rumex salicifolius]